MYFDAYRCASPVPSLHRHVQPGYITIDRVNSVVYEKWQCPKLRRSDKVVRIDRTT